MVAGDARGNVASAALSSELLLPMAPPGPPESGLIFARDLATAFPLVVERATSLLASGKVYVFALSISCFEIVLIEGGRCSGFG
jgi:hypothetical protein